MRSRTSTVSLVRWLPFVVAALVLAVVAATGGFRSAPALGAQRFGLGEPVELRRWVLVVDEVELVNTTTYGSPAPPTLRVHLDATWTGQRTTYGLATGLITVLVPGGPATDDDPSTPMVDGYSGGFDPDVGRPVVLELVWPAGSTQDTPRRPAPGTVEVVIRDERPAQNFLFADEWASTRPVGHVSAPLVDRRTR